MSQNRLPNDAVHSISSLVAIIFWHCSILGLLVMLISLVFVSRERLVDVARTDRVVMAYDAFPVTYAPWGVFMANREVSLSRHVIGGHQSSDDGDAMMTSFRKQTAWVQAVSDKFMAYWALASPRMVILGFFLAGILAMAWMAWGYGSYLNALHVLKGRPLSALSYRNWKTGLGFAYAVLFSYPFWPFPLSSWALIVPITGIVVCTVYMRRWRA